MELLEIGKASAAGCWGMANMALPTSLRIGPVVKERNLGAAVTNNAKFKTNQINLNKTFQKTIAWKIWLTIFIWFALDYTSRNSS